MNKNTDSKVEWVETTFGEIVELSSGKNPPSEIRSPTGKFRILGANGEIGRATECSHVGPFIVIGRVGAYGKIHRVLDESCWISDNALIARPIDERVSTLFLSHLLSLIDFESIKSGSTQPLITQSSVLRLKCEVPPLHVQARIVDVMSHVDGLLAGLHVEREALGVLRGSLLASLLNPEGGLLPAGTEWTETTLGEIARVERGASWSKDQEVPDHSGDPVIRIANVQPEGIDLSVVRSVVGLKPRDKERGTISSSTVLMVGSNGNPGRIGNAYLSEPSIEGMVLASFLIGIHANDVETAKWLYYYLSNREVQSSITESTAGSTGLKNLKIEWLREFPVPVPPLSVQAQIVSAMSEVDATAAALDAEIESLVTLRASLLHGLLNQTIDIPDTYDNLF